MKRRRGPFDLISNSSGSGSDDAARWLQEYLIWQARDQAKCE
jgi:hypothetical protein